MCNKSFTLQYFLMRYIPSIQTNLKTDFSPLALIFWQSSLILEPFKKYINSYELIFNYITFSYSFFTKCMIHIDCLIRIIWSKLCIQCKNWISFFFIQIRNWSIIKTTLQVGLKVHFLCQQCRFPSLMKFITFLACW